MQYISRTAAMLLATLIGLFLTQPAWALSTETELALAEVRQDLLDEDCRGLIDGRSGATSAGVLESLVALGQEDCPNPRDREPKCPGLREVFSENPTTPDGRAVAAISILQGGAFGSTALFKAFQQGLSDPADFAPGEVPFPGLSQLEARELILLHELAHTQGSLGDDRVSGAPAFNSAIVRLCIRPVARPQPIAAPSDLAVLFALGCFYDQIYGYLSGYQIGWSAVEGAAYYDVYGRSLQGVMEFKGSTTGLGGYVLTNYRTEYAVSACSESGDCSDLSVDRAFMDNSLCFPGLTDRAPGADSEAANTFSTLPDGLEVDLPAP